MFSAQPMFTKMVLPILGGSPAVWNTVVVFFQATVLAGYLYAHAITRFLPLRAQILCHIAVLTAVFVALPLTIAPDWNPPLETTPVFWLFGLLAVTVGPPAFATSTSAPLLQNWFARTGHASAADPYFLYGASNLGSLVALLGYPTLIAPLLGLSEQGKAWAWGYAALAAFICLSGYVTWRWRSELQPVPPANTELVSTIDWPLRLRWILLSFAPSSLLLGVTLHISTDVAAAPFVWVAPLALYLLSFIFVFARKPLLKHGWMLQAQVFVLIPLAVYFTVNLLWLVFLVHLLGLFVTAMVCHGELSKRRPVADHLTEFYLWMSIGGVLGGLFGALLAPALFNSVIEYPLVLVLACLLRPSLATDKRHSWIYDLVFPAILAGAMLLIYLPNPLNPAQFGETGKLAFFGSVAISLYIFRLRPLRFALGIGAVLFTPLLITDKGTELARARSFFGISVVESYESGRLHMMRHGTTIHGIQIMEDAHRLEPLSYYGREGPLGQLFLALNRRGPIERVGAVGLGAGSIACYRRPGQQFTFFELDPWIERFARDESLFHYLSDCGGDEAVRLGDGRRSLMREPDGAFDFLVLDAFSSDAIPVHLITREALNLYMRKLKPNGVIAFHISNNFIDLEPVLASLSKEANFTARVQTHVPADVGPGRSSALFSSIWVAIAKSTEDLKFLENDTRWTTLRTRANARTWTDDYSNIFTNLIWTRGFNANRQSRGSELQ